MCVCVWGGGGGGGGVKITFYFGDEILVLIKNIKSIFL